jgi:hypothetical protein
VKTLNVIEAAYRGTLEEQDDTVVWITHAMKGAGADLGVLLRGSAVNYTVRAQDASGLEFGAERQTQPPRLADDVAALIGKGVPVYAVEDDIAERGIVATELIDGVRRIARAEIPALFASFDRVWHW